MRYRVTEGGLKPSAPRRIFPLSSTGDVTFDIAPRMTGNEAVPVRHCHPFSKVGSPSFPQMFYPYKHFGSFTRGKHVNSYFREFLFSVGKTTFPDILKGRLRKGLPCLLTVVNQGDFRVGEKDEKHSLKIQL